jgi:hypothetical protein
MRALAVQRKAEVQTSLLPKVAAVFDLKDENERRIFDVIQRYFTDPPGVDNLHAIHRGVRHTEDGPRRVVWTVSCFQPRRRGAKTEWSIITWDIDEISMGFLRCQDQQQAMTLFESLRSEPGNS